MAEPKGRLRPLGEVLEPAGEVVRVADLRMVRYAGVRWYAEGVYEREAVPAAQVKAASLMRISPGQVTYNRMWATKAAFGVVGPECADCVVTNDFPVFEVDPSEALPGYIGLLMRWPTFQAEAAARAVGTTERRRLKQDQFLAIEVPLPPLAEQRRIFDLIVAVDRTAQGAAAAAEAAGALLRIHLDALDATSLRRLGDLADIGSGPSWKSDQEHQLPVDGGQPVIGITNTRPDGRLDLTERRYVVGLSGKVRTLSQHSLIMIRTNGNRQRIGNIYRATPDAVGSAVSAFQIAMEPTEEGISDFLFWVLRRPSTQRLISEAASGTTGLGNVAVKWLRELELPWPEDAERERYVGLAEALLRTQEAAEDGTAELRVLRSALLDDLLSGEQEIPSSYDALLESV